MKPINQNMMSKKPFANDLEQKVPTYHIVPSNTKVDKAIQNKEESNSIALTRPARNSRRG
jgi:hypothetical protein